MSELYPTLTKGWRFRQRERGWIGEHPRYGCTQAWSRRLSAMWAAKLLELAYHRAKGERPLSP